MAGGWTVMASVSVYAFLVWRFVRRTGRKPRFSRDAFWIGPFAELLGSGEWFGRLQPALQRPRMWLAVLEGGVCAPERLLRWTAESAGLAYAVFVGGWFLASVTGSLPIGWFALLIAGLVPALRARDLSRRVERRRQTMLMELPVLLSRLLVLVNAGEQVWRALARCADNRPNAEHPLYGELRSAVEAVRRGESMSLALEEFGRRCAIPEAKLFSSAVIMNAKRGGGDFVPALRDLTRQMWDRRKSAARTLGEQASSRLAFPLAVIFLLIIALVAAPALMSM